MRHLLITITLGLLIACGQGVQHDTPLPDTIQNMQLQEVIQGEEANAIVTKLHQKRVTTRESVIGRYQDNQYDATLYITMYQHPDSALRDLEQMARRIRDPEIGGKMGFQHVRELPSYGENVYMALQNRRAHYFYVVGENLYWLDANPNVGMASLEELLKQPA